MGYFDDYQEICAATAQNDIRKLLNLVSMLDSIEVVDQSNRYGETQLHKASSYGRLEVAKVLIYFGARVDVVDNKGWTPLHNASAKGHLEIVKLLVEFGANVNATDKDGWTPGQRALNEGHYEVVDYLS